jgi:hypothetical protein
MSKQYTAASFLSLGAIALFLTGAGCGSKPAAELMPEDMLDTDLSGEELMLEESYMLENGDMMEEEMEMDDTAADAYVDMM